MAQVQNVDVQVIEGTKPRRVAWSLLLSGVMMLVMGVIAFFWPGLALETIALMVGVGFFVAGVGSVVDFFAGGGFKAYSGWLLASAVADILLGGVFLARPIISLVLLTWMLSFLIVAVGLMQVFSGFKARKVSGAAGALQVVGGVLTVVIGVLIMTHPATIVMWVSAFALVYGVALVVLAFRVPKALNVLAA